MASRYKPVNMGTGPSPRCRTRGAMAVGDRSKPPVVLDAVIAAAKAGELDAAIDVAKGDDKRPKRKAA